MTRTKRRKILVADDDASAMLRFLRHVEKTLDCECRTAVTFKDALDQIYSGERWDAAVFDLVLPLGEMPTTVASSEQLKVFTHEQAAVALAIAFQETSAGSPMIVWSSAPQPDGLEPFLSEGVCRYFDKFGFSTGAWDEMTAFLAQPPKNRLSNALADSVLLNPNVHGIGVDLKRFLSAFRQRPKPR